MRIVWGKTFDSYVSCNTCLWRSQLSLPVSSWWWTELRVFEEYFCFSLAVTMNQNLKWCAGYYHLKDRSWKAGVEDSGFQHVAWVRGLCLYKLSPLVIPSELSKQKEVCVERNLANKQIPDNDTCDTWRNHTWLLCHSQMQPCAQNGTYLCDDI